MNAHPAADAFPLMEGGAFDALVADIRANGLREPIVRTKLDRKLAVLDGRNRLRACELAGVKPRFVDFAGDPIAFVVSANLARRHLNESQRALVAARLATLPPHRPKKSANLPASPTQAEAAAMLNTSERSVRHAREVLTKAAPEVVQAVDRGELAVSAAAELTKLEHDEQRNVLDATNGDGRRVRIAIRRRERTEKLADIARGNAPLGAIAQRFPILYADPPWRYEHCMSEAIAIENQYPTMPLEDICALDIGPKLATPDALLFLWSTSPKLAEAMRVIEAWGFVYRTSMVWDKEIIGAGYWARQQHELLLVAMRGNMPAPPEADRPASLIRQRRSSVHSQKPTAFAEAIERMYPTLPKIELFARQARPGWAVWGNQAPSTEAA